jgi:RNA polymerase sigma factor (sigma-70 family)
LSLTEEQFQQLLAWLDKDPTRAGLKYEEIRRKLIIIFLNRNCEEVEDLADETINRVARKVCELKDSYVGDPARYFFGVAKRIFSEHVRKVSKRRRIEPLIVSSSDSEPRLKCLDECLDQLDPDSRELILSYYQGKKQAKIQAHKAMEESLNINAGALRARTHRIRQKLQKCILACLERSSESNDIN